MLSVPTEKKPRSPPPRRVRAEGIWSLLKRAMVNFADTDLGRLVRIIKRKLKKIQYRPHLIDGCLAATGLTEPGYHMDTTSSSWLVTKVIRRQAKRAFWMSQNGRYWIAITAKKPMP